jgi:hypothetical protein
MEFLVEFEVKVPDGTLASEVEDRSRAEAAAAATLTDEGRLVRVSNASAALPQTVIGMSAPTPNPNSTNDWLFCRSMTGFRSASLRWPHPNDPGLRSEP